MMRSWRRARRAAWFAIFELLSAPALIPSREPDPQSIRRLPSTLYSACNDQTVRRRLVAHLNKVVDGEVGERVGVLFSPNEIFVALPGTALRCT
jgi:hypothetical protein